MEQRWQEIRTIHRDYEFMFKIFNGVVLVAFGIFVGANLFADDPGYSTNLYTEFISIGITVLVLNLLAEQREKRRYKQQLIRELGSKDNGTALRASEALRDNGWLWDGTLMGARLREANLENADISRADLKGAELVGVNLSKAKVLHVDLAGVQMSDSDLSRARMNASNLEGVVMMGAKLIGTDLRYSRFVGAILDESNLKEANLTRANLSGACLINVNLEDANLEDAIFDENTTMPDGKRWYPGIDLSKYNNPYHPDFWRPTDDSWLHQNDDSKAPWWLEGQSRYE